jgi:hypothetical protein
MLQNEKDQRNRKEKENQKCNQETKCEMWKAHAQENARPDA